MTSLCFNTFNRSAYLGVDPLLEEQIEAARRAGYRLFGPDVYSLAHYVESGGQLEVLAEKLEQANMRCFEIAALGITGDEDETQRALDSVVEAAKILQPDYVLTNVMSAVDDACVDRLRRADGRLAEVSAGLALEYLPFSEVPGIRASVDLLDRAVCSNGYVLVDTWHFFNGPDTWADLEGLPLERIAYVQFDDHPALASEDLAAETISRRVMPGDGVFDLARFVETFRAKGFDGVVSVEILNDAMRRDDDLTQHVQETYERSAHYWS